MSEEFSRVALVTGATSGIGLASAKRLAQSGHRIFICARKVTAVESTVSDMRSEGFQVDGVSCDVTDVTQVEQLVKAAVDRFGPISVLVNNAGRSGGGVT